MCCGGRAGFARRTVVPIVNDRYNVQYSTSVENDGRTLAPIPLAQAGLVVGRC
jgi:hypothetical protein